VKQITQLVRLLCAFVYKFLLIVASSTIELQQPRYVNTSAIDCLEGLFSEITCDMLSGASTLHTVHHVHSERWLRSAITSHQQLGGVTRAACRYQRSCRCHIPRTYNEWRCECCL